MRNAIRTETRARLRRHLRTTRLVPGRSLGREDDSVDDVVDLAALSAAEWDARKEAAVLKRIETLRFQVGEHQQEIFRLQQQLPPPIRAQSVLSQFLRPLRTSLGVLMRRADRNDNIWDFISRQTFISARVMADLFLGRSGARLLDVLPHSSLLVTHTPAIYAQIDQLAVHVPGIVAILDDNLPLIEPHLDAILERFDDIEPHLPWVLEHIDSLAPYCGELLAHIDSLLLYADSPEDSGWADKLLSYIPFIVPYLDDLEPHLPYLRPHLPKIYPVLPRLAPYIGRFSKFVVCSKNADILLWYFGWVLRLPLLHNVFRIPLVPRMCAWAARILPKRPVRGGHCVGVECSLDGLYDKRSTWNRLLPKEQDGDWFTWTAGVTLR